MKLPLPPVIVAAEPLHVALAIFAHNVATGGALCAAFEEGMEQQEYWTLYHAHGHRLGSLWRPGCELVEFRWRTVLDR